VSSPSAITAPASLLEVVGMSAGYNGSPVVREITLSVAAGEVVALLGANGAGKTTTLSVIAGLMKPLGGSITLAGTSIVGRAAQRLHQTRDD
jgi:branched-chain amino acid transport system ATP-binding protein